MQSLLYDTYSVQFNSTAHRSSMKWLVMTVNVYQQFNTLVQLKQLTYFLKESEAI